MALADSAEASSSSSGSASGSRLSQRLRQSQSHTQIRGLAPEMTNGSSNGSSNERRAGGLAQGAKTPRKVVQWAASTKGEGPMAAHHHLDEEGLDPKAFQTLTYALERHQSDSRDSLGLAPGDNAPPAGNANSNTNGGTAPTTASLPASTSAPAPALGQRISTISTSNSTAPTGSGSGTGAFTPTHLSPLASDSSRDASPERDRAVPGENIIEPTEVYGLPRPVGTPDEYTDQAAEETRRIERRATRLVRAHARGFQFLAGFKGDKAMNHMQPEDIDAEAPRARPAGRTRGRARRSWRAEGSADHEDEDVEMEAQRFTAGPALGTGVLSALLSLYDRPPGSMGSGGRSGFSTPGDRTPPSVGTPTPEAEMPNPFERRRSYNQRRETIRARGRVAGVQIHEEEEEAEGQDKSGTEPGAGSRTEATATSTNADTGALTPPNTLRELTRTMSGGLEKVRSAATTSRFAASLPPLFGGERPAGARSGGGVFGALVASTGNLTGIAAPEPSRIAPNTRRPGYHLSRYSWSDEPGPTHPAPVYSRGGAAGSKTMLGGQTSPSPPSMSAPTSPAGEEPPSAMGSGESASPSTSPSADATPLSGSPFFGGVATGAGAGGGAAGTALVPERSRSDSMADSLTLANVSTRGSAMTAATTASTTTGMGTGGRKKWTGILKDFPRPHSISTLSGWADTGASAGARSLVGTPDTASDGGDYWDEKHRRWTSGLEEKKKRKRKKAEIYITRHVAEIMQRQEFILKLARAFMMFGAPTHRLTAQIQATARVLDMQLSCMYLPDMMLISFDDAATSTSNIKFIRQGAALNLGKLQDAYDLYWNVIHDEISVSDASRSLDVLMQQRPLYNATQLVLVGGFCSAAICSLSFAGSFIDSLVSFPLGALLVAVQIVSVRNELYSNIFEITIATLLSFLVAVLAGTRHFCYSAVASASIVLILPGFLVLNGSLELSSRNIVSGAVRLCYAIMYAIFLGFGLSIGGTLYETFTGQGVVDPEDYTCASSHHADGAWYQRTPTEYWAFLTVPMYSLFLSLRNQAPWKKKELLVTIIISCIGWTCNHFSALKFPNRNDVSSAIGAFAVGLIANVYGRFFSGNAFVIMITGILFQLPSGLGNGGLITFASRNNEAGSATSYLSGFQTALQLISVSVGLTVGLGISLVVVFPIQSRKRAGGVFSL